MILRQNSAQVSEIEVCAYLRDSEMLMYSMYTALFASFFLVSSSLATFFNGLSGCEHKGYCLNGLLNSRTLFHFRQQCDRHAHQYVLLLPVSGGEFRR